MIKCALHEKESRTNEYLPAETTAVRDNLSTANCLSIMILSVRDGVAVARMTLDHQA
jgi:hypothetical protein